MPVLVCRRRGMSAAWVEHSQNSQISYSFECVEIVIGDWIASCHLKLNEASRV